MWNIDAYDVKVSPCESSTTIGKFEVNPDGLTRLRTGVQRSAKAIANHILLYGRVCAYDKCQVLATKKSETAAALFKHVAFGTEIDKNMGMFNKYNGSTRQTW